MTENKTAITFEPWKQSFYSRPYYYREVLGQNLKIIIQASIIKSKYVIAVSDELLLSYPALYSLQEKQFSFLTTAQEAIDAELKNIGLNFLNL